MTDFDKKLASRLSYLPLMLSERVYLWLTYRGIKPVSDIGFIKDKKNPKTKRIIKWLKDAGLCYIPESTSKNNYVGVHISKDKEKAELLDRLSLKDDKKSEFTKGTLYGFPEKAAGVPKNMLTGEYYTHPYLKNKYFTPYMLYGSRRDHIKEDSQTAKLWADTIRKEVPTLAKWFENKGQKDKSSTIKHRKKYPKITKPASQLLAEYLKTSRLSKENYSEKKLKRVFLKTVKVYLYGRITTQKLSIIAHKLSNLAKNKKPEDKELFTAISSAKVLYKIEGKLRHLKMIISNFKTLAYWYKKNK